MRSGEPLWRRPLVLTALTTALKALFTVVIAKMVALAGGGAGVSLHAHALNLVNLIMIVPQQAAAKGGVRYLANALHPSRMRAYWSGLLLMGNLACLAACLLLALLPLAGYDWLADFTDLLGPMGRYWAVACMALAWIYANQQLWIVAPQGRQRLREYALLTASASGLACLLLLATQKLPLWAVVLAHPAGLALSLLPTWLVARRAFRGLPRQPLRWALAWRQQAPYFLLATTYWLAQGIDFGMRGFSLQQLGAEATGYWQVPAQLSTYLQIAFYSSFLAIFYPKVAALGKPGKQALGLLLRWGGLALLALAAGLALLYGLRRQVVEALFSPELLPAADLFSRHLPGDFLALASKLLFLFVMAFGKVRALIAYQVGVALAGIALLALFPVLGLYTFPLTYTGKHLVGLLWLLALLFGLLRRPAPGTAVQ